MNRNEWEQWMKESLGKQEFLPGEQGWNKLKEALHTPSENTRKPFIIPLSFKLKAAAVVLMLFGGGLTAYLLLHNNNRNETVDIAHNSKPSLIAVPHTQQIQKERTEEKIITPQPVQKSNLVTTKTQSVNTVITTASLNRFDTLLPSRRSDVAVPVSEPVSVKETKEPQTPKSLEQYTPILPEITDRNKNRSLNVGVAAQFGKASVGNMQYQVGVVAYRNISEKFFAKATLALASTDVSYVQQNSFSAFQVNAVGNATIEKRNIEAKYGNNILSLGIAPNIGYRIARRFSISCGLAVYRNLDQSINLENEETIAPSVISNDIISTEKSISEWDAGVTGSATYQAGKKLSIDIQYRYGISSYMYFNNEAIRNSGVGVGLSYLFGK